MRLLMIIVCFLPALLVAEAYRYVDPKTGEVVFTDKPPARQQADKIKIQEPLISTPYQSPPSDAPAKPDQQAETATDFSLSILTPEHDTAIRNNAGNVTVSVSLTNADKIKDFSIRYILNGETAVVSPSLTTTLENIDRGTHSISAELISQDGEVRALAEPHTFHLKRVSIR